MGTETVIGAAPALPGRHVALYVRVSTQEQDLEGQERQLRELCEARSWEVVEVYKEKVSAWKKTSVRSEYDRLHRDLPLRKWDTVVVWSLDRYSRAQQAWTAMADIQELREQGVKFVSLTEPMLETPDPGDLGREFAWELLTAVQALVAKFESTRKAERITLAMEELRSGRRQTKSGRPVGRPRVADAKTLLRIQELKDAGMLWREISQRVGLSRWSCENCWRRWRRGEYPDAPAPSQPLPRRNPDLSEENPPGASTDG